MDIHEADKNHLIQAHASAMDIVQTHPDWLRIDCESQGNMRDIDAIAADILATLAL
jgi:hypothetical protein